MRQILNFDPVQRQHEKARARELDDRALRSGKISREELRGRNSFFSSLEIVHSSVRRRGIIG